MSRLHQDAEEMRRSSKAVLKTVNGTPVWIEDTVQCGKRFQLAFTFENGYYRAYVTKGYQGGGVDAHVFPNQELCLRGDSDRPFTSAAQIRAKAILWARLYVEYCRTGHFPVQGVA